MAFAFDEGETALGFAIRRPLLYRYSFILGLYVQIRIFLSLFL